MAFALVQSAQNNGTSPVVTAYGSTPSAGNLLIATFKKNNQAASSISDGGSAWTEATVSPFNFNSTSSQIRVFYKIADASQSSSITTSGTGTHFLSIYEFSGNQGSLTGIEVGAVAYSQGGSGLNNNYSGIEITPSSNDSLVIACIGLSAAVTAPAFTGSTLLQSNVTGNIQLVDGYTLQGSMALIRPFATWTTSRVWGAITIAFKSASPATPIPTSFGSSVTSMPVVMPASIVAGELLVASVEVRNAGTWSTVPTGWTAFYSQAGGGSAGKIDGFYKIAAGTESGTTPTWIASASTTASWQVRRISSWHGTTPPEATTSSGDATSADPPSLSPSWGSDNNIWIAIAGHTAISPAAFTAAPAGYADFLNTGASSSGSATSLASSSKQSVASTENPGAFTAGGSNRFWAAATIAVRPAGAGAVTNSRFLAFF